MVSGPKGTEFWLRDARVPACLLSGAAAFPAADGLARLDLRIAAGRIAAILPAGQGGDGAELVDLDGGMVWPTPVDVHTHLDKGHIWPRAPNPDGTFDAALAAVAADRAANWSAEDVRLRMQFALRCAYAHGTRAIRTHLDSIGPQTAITWPVFAELRAEWAGRITLQGVCLTPLEAFRDAALADELVRTVVSHGGVLGAVPYMTPDLDALLDRFFALAAGHGLDCDFHVDETLDPTAAALRAIAEAALRARFAGRILCGHCCSLSRQDADAVDRTLDLVARAGIAVVSLPLCNLYLMGRTPGATPRLRGVTLLHEMAARGIAVCVASDNTRDPFYGYGDLDAVEVFRESARIAHLDRPVGDWPRAITATPAWVMRLPDAGMIAVGVAADLIAFRGRFWDEVLARPQHDRLVLRDGRAIAAGLPDYRALPRPAAAGG